MSVRDLIDKRNALVVREREMNAEAEKSGYTSELRVNLDKIDVDLTEAQGDLERALKAEGRGLKIGGGNGPAPRNLPAERGEETDPSEMTKRTNAEFAAFVRQSTNGTYSFKGRATRALQGDLDTIGGYTVQKEQFNAELIKAVDDQVFVRGLSRSFTLTASESLGTPSRDSNATNATWGSELTVGASDTGLTYGKRELTPHPLSAYAVVSKKLLRSSALNIEGEVRDRLAYALSIPAEQAYLNGGGSNRPLGLFTVSSVGVTSGRDITTASSSGVIASYQELIDVQYGLKGAYWRNSAWIINRFHHKDIRKLQDGNGTPVWMPAGLGTVLNALSYDSLLTRPVYMSEYAPVSSGYGSSYNTPAITGESSTAALTGRVAIFGDFSQYWTATALDLEIDHLVELKALTNQDVFVARLETDGMPVLAEAFSVLRLKGF